MGISCGRFLDRYVRAFQQWLHGETQRVACEALVVLSVCPSLGGILEEQREEERRLLG